MNKHKLLILDGISGVPLAKEIHEAFCEAGIDAIYADLKKFTQKYFYGLRSTYRKVLNKRENSDSFFHLPKLNEQDFEAYIQKELPTTILVIGFIYKYLDPQFVERIKRQYGLKLYLYDTDSCNLYSKRREFIFFLDTELPVYERIFSFSKVTTQFFSETKQLKATFFPFGAKKLDITPNPQPFNEVLFVGSCDLRRIFLLEHIKENVTIYGDRWQRNFPLISQQLKQRVTDQSLWGEKLYQTLTNSKIVLNITRSHFYGAETGVNLRIFEALSAGCFLLTDYCEELAELFIVGEEIEVFRNATELAEKVSFYLAHPEERNKIARQGHARFLKDYTWRARIEKLRQYLSL